MLLAMTPSPLVTRQSGCRPDARPVGRLTLALDHLSLRVDDVGRQMRRLLTQGGRLTPAFTPDGPVEIAAFRDEGVRFVFFDRPEGWPMEFCHPRSARYAKPQGHDHFGMRSADLDAIEAQLTDLGATRLAQHRLTSGPEPVNVRFLQLGGRIFELFDEMPAPIPNQDGRGWIGFLP